MTGRPGARDDQKIWARCPFCGDSKNRYKAHLAIYQDGSYHCFRCTEHGNLPAAMYLQTLEALAKIPLGDYKATSLAAALAVLEPGAATPRPSKLPRHHLRDREGIVWEGFIAYDQHGDAVGLSLIHGAARKTYGTRGIGTQGKPLVSTFTDPLRVLEGPWDILDTHDICTFGSISKAHLKMLSHQYIILCPDGDVWMKPELRKYLRKLLKQLLIYGDPVVTEVEFIMGGKDPDEVPPEERIKLPLEEAFILCQSH